MRKVQVNLNKKLKIEKDQGKEGAAIKIMYLFLKLTIHTVLVN